MKFIETQSPIVKETKYCQPFLWPFKSFDFSNHLRIDRKLYELNFHSHLFSDSKNSFNIEIEWGWGASIKFKLPVVPLYGNNTIHILFPCPYFFVKLLRFYLLGQSDSRADMWLTLNTDNPDLISKVPTGMIP